MKPERSTQFMHLFPVQIYDILTFLSIMMSLDKKGKGSERLK